MTAAESNESVDLGRRLLLTRGAAVAGAAAGAVAIGIAGARPAAAADGDTLKVGQGFSGSTATGLTVNSTSQPALRLANSTGTALQITPRARFSDSDTLPIGAFSADPTGPVVGIGDGDGGSYAGGIAVLSDLDTLPLPFPGAGVLNDDGEDTGAPQRRVDTRYASGRTNILDTSGLDKTSYKLKAGNFIDVVVYAADPQFTLTGVFLNLTSTGATANGFLSSYPPYTPKGESNPRPNASTLSYSKGVTIANFSLTAVNLVEDNFIVRIYASATTHVIVDLVGVIANSIPSTSNQRKAAQRTAKRSAARRPAGLSAARRR